MNNKRNIWRLHHKENINIGPYTYSSFIGNQEIKDILLKKEPFNKERKHIKYKICNPNINKFGISSYFLQRPGVLEDPKLRYNFLQLIKENKKIGKKTKIGIFGFDSKEQLLSWFDNEEELKFLESKGFIISKIKVEQKNLLMGDKQVMLIE